MKIGVLFFSVIYLALAHIHAISNLTADWTDNSTEGSLKRRRMELRITPALIRTTISGGGILCIELSPNTSHSLLLHWRKGKNLPTYSAKGAKVIINDSLVTVFVTNVSQSS